MGLYYIMSLLQLSVMLHNAIVLHLCESWCLLQAVWLMLPWWVDTAVPVILDFMEGGQGAKTAEQSK